MKLVTGGLGFIGSDAVRMMLPNEPVYVVDNYSSNCMTLEELNEGMPNYANVIPRPIQTVSVLPKSVDYIYHYASPVGPAGILKYPGRIGEYIIGDLSKAISLCIKYDAPLVFISTSEVYGRREHLVPLKETDTCLMTPPYTVRNEYAQAKLLAEIMIENTAKQHPQFKYHIFRPFNICGERQLPDGGFVIPRFVQAAVKGKPLTVFGDGSQIRSFLHVRDLNKAIESVVAGNYLNQIWNVGNPFNTLSIKALAELVIDISGSKSQIRYVDPKDIYGPTYAEAWDKSPNINKIVGATDWRPTKQLNHIIADVVKYWRDKV